MVTDTNQIAKYVKRLVVIFLVSSAIDIVIHYASSEGVQALRSANASFVSAVRHMDAWHVLVLFVHAFGAEAARQPSHGWIGPALSAVGDTLQEIWSEGFWSVLVAAIALVLGFLATSDSGQPNRMSGGARIFWIPVAGCALLWVLLQVMLLGGWLFGFFLIGAQTVVGLSVTVPLFHAVLEERGEHVTDKILKKAAGPGARARE